MKRAVVVLCTQKNRDGVEIEDGVFTGPTCDADAQALRRRLSIRGVRDGWFEIRSTFVPWRCDCGDVGCEPGKCFNRPA